MLPARTARRARVAALASLQFGLATTDAELDGAFRLVHDQYVARGYMRAQPGGRRTTLHHALPETRVFVARADGRVVATVSLVPDSILGMPCDALYPDEVQALRARGRRLAEVSSLAVADGATGGGIEVVRALVQLVAVYASRLARIDDLCITVNPRHARFYEALLRFVRFGPVRRYEAVNGAPAIGLRLDLATALASTPDAADVPFAAHLFTPAEIARVLPLLRRQERRLKRGHAHGPPPLASSAAAEV